MVHRNNNTRRPPSWRLQQPVLALWFAFLFCILHRSESAHGEQQPQPLRQRQQSEIAVDLPFGEINVLVLTDTHSWIGGHSNEPKYNADYGDVLSFYQRLHEYCQRNRMDLWFVVNGDWIDGTGLSMGGDVSYLTPLLEKMDWDALNIGNHELYRSDVIHESMRPGGFVESWGDRYLSSNVLYAPHHRPMGKQYRFLRGQYNGTTVLTFGFLYNMEDASDAVIVETVETVIEEQWFIDVLTNPRNDPEGKYDAIMVLAHMDVRDQLVTTLLNKIRSLVGKTMPVQFITGHTHIRDVHTMDEASNSFEAGKFLDTLGFVSFPSQKTVDRLSGNRRRGLQQQQEQREDEEEEEEEGEGETPALLGPGGTEWPNVSDSTTNNSTTTTASSSSLPAATTANPTNSSTTVAPTTTSTTTSTSTTSSSKPTASQLFRQKFIDTDVAMFESILGVSPGGLATEDGSRLSKFIFRTRSELGLLDLYGCTSKNYYMNRTIDAKDSIWKLFVDEVAPYQLLKPQQKQAASANQQQARVFLGDSGGLRYDLLGTQLIKDDLIAVSPFNESIIALGPNISGAVVKKLVEEILNKEENPYDSNYANYLLSPPLEDIKPNKLYEIMAPRFGLSKILDGLEQIKYNGTVDQEESGFYTTDLWLQFVKDNWKCKENDNTQSQEHHTTGGSSSHGHNSGGGGGGGGSHHHTGSSSSSSSSGHGHGKGVHSGAPKYYYQDDAAEDKRRTIMASIALACVAVLGTLYIWQLHRDWLAKYHERQRLIFLADEENGHDNELI